MSRILVEEKEDKITVTIKALLDVKKQQMLMVWICLFSVCGLVILSQFFMDFDNKAMLFFAIYMAFWAFFEFKVIYAYRWRKKGKEIIELNKSEIILMKEIGRRGITQKYALSDVKDLTLFKSEEGGFFKAMNTSYWNINKYSLVFTNNNIQVPFAIDLDEKDSNKLLKVIKRFIHQKS